MIALVIATGAVRIDAALSDPNFDRADPKGMLRSDPALLYYVTERIVEAHGAAPADLRGDRRIEHPLASDWPAMETVGQEFAVAWAKLWLAPEMPLHVVAVWVMGFAAAATAIGVFGLALELSGSALWGLVAALLFAISTANYRTVALVLMREDFSLPWFALHLWLLARAARVRTAASIAFAGLALLAALSTWHAMLFIVTCEAACAFAWYLRSGENPLGARRAWLLPALLVLGGLAIPVLRAKWFLLSMPMQITLALLVEARLAPRTASRARRAAIALGSLLMLVFLARFLGSGVADYSHVFAFFEQKLLHLGALPDDPAELTYEARLLWQGPFQTGRWIDVREYAFPALLLAPAAGIASIGWWRGRGDGFELVLILATLVSSVLALMIERLLVLPGMLAPVVAAVTLSKLRPQAIAFGIAFFGASAQGAEFQRLVSRYSILWYRPAAKIEELAKVIDWIDDNVPPDGTVASDYVNSPAILAHTGRAGLYQPKYETLRSRQRIEAFDRALFHGTPARLRELLLAQDARWLVIDRLTLLGIEAYIAGIPRGAPLPQGSPAAGFLSTDPARLAGVPGFHLVYRSPPTLGLDMFRVYALE